MAKKENAIESKNKKIFKLVVTIIQIILIIITVTVSIITIVNVSSEKNKKPIFIGGKAYMPVLTESMEGDKDDSIFAGDIVVIKKITAEEGKSLEVGDIITFLTLDKASRKQLIVTHRINRIVSVNSETGKVTFETKGDNADLPDPTYIYSDAIFGVYSSHMKGAGKPIIWLQEDSTHFFLLIVVPLIILVLINGYQFAKLIIQLKFKKMQQKAALESIGAEGATSEELKQFEEFKKAKAEEERKQFEEFKKMQALKDSEQATEKDNATENNDTAKE